MEYPFESIEKKWQNYWKVHKTFAAKSHDNTHKPPYYVLDMFPYPSGAGLHVGHPLGYIASDIYARYKRHQGFNVLHPMGYDSFGLPAEQYAIQTGQHPEITTKVNIARYREQLDKLGLSFDWEREVRTSSPEYYKWTQWIFIRLFNSWYNTKLDKAADINELIVIFEKSGFSHQLAEFKSMLLEKYPNGFTADDWKGFDAITKEDILQQFRLAYLSNSMVNWCPQLGTVLANEEVKDGVSERGGFAVERKLMKQWSLRISAYAERLLAGLEHIDWPESIKEAQRNWIGKSSGSSLFFKLEQSNHAIEVFTTRPDTIFGVSFLAIAPEHELALHLTTIENRAQVIEYITQAKNRSERERMAEVKRITGVFWGAMPYTLLVEKKFPFGLPIMFWQAMEPALSWLFRRTITEITHLPNILVYPSWRWCKVAI